LNSIIITGRITHDIELKTSAAGTEYTNFSVAVDRRRKDKDGNKQTDFFKVSVFGKSAVFCQTYFHKGDGINIQGRMESDKYTNKDGVEVTGWTLMAENVEFPHGKGKTSSDGAASEPTALTGNDRDLPF
jgi:single-strand DNA-binding protein